MQKICSHLDKMEKILKPLTELTMSQVYEKKERKRKEKELHCSSFPKPHVKVTSNEFGNLQLMLSNRQVHNYDTTSPDVESIPLVCCSFLPLGLSCES